MSRINPIYLKLAAKMNAPQNKALPRLLRKIADLEQARILDELPNTSENIADKLKLSKKKVEKHLQYLFERGLIAPGKSAWVMVNNIGVLKDRVASANPMYDDDEFFDLAREMSLETSKALANQLKKGEKYSPVLQVMRVVPKWRAIKDIPGVLPCEDARQIFKNASPIVVHRCPCRMVYRERPCKDEVPVEVCLAVNITGERFLERKAGKKLTYDETIELLDTLDKDFSLVNTTGNSNRMPEVLCSCCNDCCGLFVRASYTKPLLGKVPYVKSRFEVEDNPKACFGCGTCVERCPVNAITMKELKSGEKRSDTDFKECIGCGICVLTCPQNARKLKLVRPPEHIPDFMMGFDTEGLPTVSTSQKKKE